MTGRVGSYTRTLQGLAVLSTDLTCSLLMIARSQLTKPGSSLREPFFLASSVFAKNPKRIMALSVIGLDTTLTAMSEEPAQ
jgi:hypothetical protein